MGADARRGSSGSATRISGSAPTGSCCSRAARTPSSSPSCGSSTPTAPRPSSRATAPARRSSTCAATAGPTRTTFSIRTVAGPITPTITGELTCSVEMGRASTDLEGLPLRRRRTARGTLSAGGREWELPARLDRQPAVRDRRRRGARGARPRRDRPGDRRPRAVPEPHQRLLPRDRRQPGAGADLRARGGGDALLGHRRQRRRGHRLPARRREPDHGRARRRRARGRDRRATSTCA